MDHTIFDPLALETPNHLGQKLTKMGNQNRFGLLTAKRLESKKAY